MGNTTEAILFNKPYGVISQFRRSPGHITLAAFGFPPAFHPAGRLDADSEGLLILTSSGRLQHILCEPRYAHPRTYLAQVERIPDGTALEQLRSGIRISGHACLPCKAAVVADPGLAPRVPPIRVRKTVPDSWIRLTLTEGKNRQARRMLAAAGHPVLRLYRKSVGTIDDNNLAPGQWRYLSKEEISAILAHERNSGPRK
ncbi:MAG TPA: pseudouridine synthase [Elusimicrobiales bacterium]|nr:pseudouridine synthase [Elusimicrobiales bacterium]